MKRELLEEMKLNRFTPQIKRNGGRVILHPISVCDINKSAKIELFDNLEIGFGHFKGSKCETFLKLQENSKLIVLGNFKLSYGATIQLFKGGELTVGRSYLNSDSLIACCKKIKIGNHVTIARGVKIYDGDHHNLLDENGVIQNEPEEIIINDNVWIGVNAVILKGVRLGEGSVVAAGSIVTNDVPPHTIVAGNPARIIKENIHWE